MDASREGRSLSLVHEAAGGTFEESSGKPLLRLVEGSGCNNHLAVFALTALDSQRLVQAGGSPRTTLRLRSRADGVVGGPWAAANGAVPMVGSRAAQVDRSCAFAPVV